MQEMEYKPIIELEDKQMYRIHMKHTNKTYEMTGAQVKDWFMPENHAEIRFWVEKIYG